LLKVSLVLNLFALNEASVGDGAVHKFTVNTNGTLTLIGRAAITVRVSCIISTGRLNIETTGATSQP